MELIAFNGYTFSSGGYWTGLPDGQNLGNYTISPQVLPRRAQGALLSGGTIGPRALTADIGYTGSLSPEAAFQRLLGILDPSNDDPRTLTALMNDGTTVECQAIALMPSSSFSDEINTVPVTFFTVDPYWRELTDTVTSVTCTESTALALVNNGTAKAFPTAKIGWTVQRTTDSATVGWKWRRQVTVTNDSGEDWYGQPVCIDLGDTAAWVTGSKAQADGDDVRLWYQGTSYARTLVCFNTKRSLLWFLATIPNGESVTYDVVYGNPSATAPLNLSTRTDDGQTYVAFDLEGYSGTATAGATGTLTDGGASWETNRWAGGFIGLVSGTGSVRWRRILSNTATVITFNRALNTAPDNTTAYVIWSSGIFMDGGRVTGGVTSTAIQDNAHTTKWGTNQLAGATVTFVGGGTASPDTMTVLSNTPDTITFTSAFSVNPTVGDSFTIQRYGVWSYITDTSLNNTAHRGLYRANRYYEMPGNLWPGELTPGGWGPDTYLDNSDDFSQLRPYDTGSGGGHGANYWAVLRARRRVRQPAQYKDESVGDGMSVYVPFRLQGFLHDWRIKNTNGIGKIVTAYKEPAGEDWQDVETYTTTQASLTATGAIAAAYIDLDAVNNPTRLGIFALPNDGVEIPSTVSTTDEVEVRTDKYTILYLDLDSFGDLASSIYSVGSEAAGYDLSVILRLGGGDESTKAPPYDRLVTGGTDHKLMLASGEKLWVRTDPSTSEPIAAVYNSSDVLQYRAPWAVRFYHHEENIDGTDTALRAREFLPLPASANLITNPTFETNTTGWTLTTTSGTVTFSRDGTVFQDAAGSLKAAINAASVGRAKSTAFATVIGQVYNVSFWWRGEDVSIDDLQFLGIQPLYIDATTSTDHGFITGIYGGYTASLTSSGVFLSRGYQFTAADTSYSLAFDFKNSLPGNSTLYLDNIIVGTPNLYISESNMGTVTVSMALREGYQG